jgi:hypothetical protein
MGKFKLTDKRAFRVSAVDVAGNEGAKSGALKVVPKLAKLSLSAAKSALKKRGFKAGKVKRKASSTVPSGKVIAGAKSGLQPAGAKIGLTVSKGSGASKRPVTPAAPLPPTAPPAAPTPTTGSTTPPPPPAPQAAPTVAPPVTSPPAAPAPEAAAQPKRGRVIPLVGPRVGSLSDLRRELGFGLLAAAFSIALVAGLRARRPASSGTPGEGDPMLLWDQRIIQAIRRFLHLS